MKPISIDKFFKILIKTLYDEYSQIFQMHRGLKCFLYAPLNTFDQDEVFDSSMFVLPESSPKQVCIKIFLPYNDTFTIIRQTKERLRYQWSLLCNSVRGCAKTVGSRSRELNFHLDAQWLQLIAWNTSEYQHFPIGYDRTQSGGPGNLPGV